MAVLVATHSGPFHADDVLSWAMLRTFYDPDAELLRSRDPAELARADIVFDVGGSFDIAARKFDHHQHDYTGPLSSAGMVLNWLESEGHVSGDLAQRLRDQLVDYVDAVDNGRRTPPEGVPCFSQIIGMFNSGCVSMADFDAAFRRAGDTAQGFVRGITAELRDEQEGAAAVVAAMADAAARGSNLLFLDRYRRWKGTYFANGGQDHPTEFVIHPGVDGRWRAVAIPPEPNSFAQKRSFPEPWAGLRDEDLAKVTGVEGSLFCHKNRFIAVFTSRAGTLEAMERFGLITGDLPD